MTGSGTAGHRTPVRCRRSWLFVPGADRNALTAASESGADVLCQELEDFTAPAQRPEARRMASEVIARWRKTGAVTAVRINPLAGDGADPIDDPHARFTQQRRRFLIEPAKRFVQMPVARMNESKCHDPRCLARVEPRMCSHFVPETNHPHRSALSWLARHRRKRSSWRLPRRGTFETVRVAPFPSRSIFPVTTDVETMIVGAGAVGLAIARTLAAAGHDVVVAERHDIIGSETSSRNSEVIHAGIYYAKGSLRAKFCVDGKHQLYRFCAENGVDHARCEKLIVAANDAQLERLDAIRATAAGNGVDDLLPLTAAEAMRLEPAVHCTGALLSPSTGLVDSHGFMLALEGHIEANGGQVALMTDITGIDARNDGSYALTIADSDIITARNVVISAGLHATKLARTLAFPGNYRPPETYYAVGQYYALSGPSPFQRHIYPMPDGAWLGLHATVDLGNRCKFGPDIEWIPEIDYSFKPEKLDKFLDFIRMYYPDLDETRLHPDYTGIRPKLYREGEPVPDFRIDTPAEHGLPGLVMLFGIESPGLTAASLSIA